MNTDTASTHPRVTVLMAVYNSSKYLHAAIKSILAQKYTDFEFLIINDGSSDTSAAIVESFADPRIVFISNPVNQGLTKSLNTGLAKARGDYIARLDADDIALPDRLALQVAYLDQQPEIVCVGGAFEIIDEQGNLLRTKRHTLDPDLIRFRLITGNQFAHPSVMFRKTVIIAEGGYNEAFRYAQDYELWSRLAHHGLKMANIADPVIQYRTHGDAISAHELTIWTAYDAAKTTIRKNVSRYIQISDEKFEVLFNRLHRNSVPSLGAAWFLWRFWGALRDAYLSREKLSAPNTRAIRNLISVERKLVIGLYVRSLASSFSFKKLHNAPLSTT